MPDDKEPWSITAKPGVLYIDHGGFLLQLAPDINGGVRTVLVSGVGRIEFALQLDEISAVISTLQHYLAADAERRLKVVEPVVPGSFPGFGGPLPGAPSAPGPLPITCDAGKGG